MISICRILVPALFLLLCTGTFAHASGDGNSDGDRDAGPTHAAHRSARADILYGQPLPISNWQKSVRLSVTDASGERSLPLAFGLSAVVPGLGQVYNRDWIGAAVFVALETVLIVSYANWKSSGNDGRDVYQAYAVANWNPVRYAEWLNSYSGYNGPEIPLPSLSEEAFKHPEQWTASQRAEVDDFFDDIRAAERQSVYLTTGAAFSHVLPYFGEQQYYELIGKYFQFAPAWSDYPGEPDDDPKAVMPNDAQFYYYAGIHADANDYFRKASTAGALIIVNHFAAAIEAVVVAKLHNQKIKPSLSLSQTPNGDILTTARVSLTF